MHSVCVLVEATVLHLPVVHALVDFLHEVVSHNTFLCGFYLLIGQLMAVEQASFSYKLDKKESAGSSKHRPSSTGLPGIFLLFIWPVILGLNFAIFSTFTSTVPITTLFFLSVLAYTFTTASKLLNRGLSLGELLSHLWNGEDLIVFGTMVKASFVGLLVIIAFRLLASNTDGPLF